MEEEVKSSVKRENVTQRCLELSKDLDEKNFKLYKHILEFATELNEQQYVSCSSKFL